MFFRGQHRALFERSYPLGAGGFPGKPFALLNANRPIAGTVDGGLLRTWINQGSSQNVTQNAVPRRPTWFSSGGPGGGPWVRFVPDLVGPPVVRQWMQNSPIVPHPAQPGVTAAVFLASDLAATRGLTGGFEDASKWEIRTTTAGAVTLFAGTLLSTPAASIVALTWYWVVCVANGAASTIELSNGVLATGNIGTRTQGNCRVSNVANETQPWFGGIAWVGMWNDGTSAYDVKTYLRRAFPSIV